MYVRKDLHTFHIVLSLDWTFEIRFIHKEQSKKKKKKGATSWHCAGAGILQHHILGVCVLDYYLTIC